MNKNKNKKTTQIQTPSRSIMNHWFSTLHQMRIGFRLISQMSSSAKTNL